jgi:hypothetical protein
MTLLSWQDIEKDERLLSFRPGEKSTRIQEISHITTGILPFALRASEAVQICS